MIASSVSLRVTVPMRTPVGAKFSLKNARRINSSVVRASETNLEQKDTKDKEGGAQIFQNAADSLGVSLGAYKIRSMRHPRTSRTFTLTCDAAATRGNILQDPLV